ncbi:hypothetical protein [Winogradskya humida]|nr:hypothetical protein [Actinoplanes humidus]
MDRGPCLPYGVGNTVHAGGMLLDGHRGKLDVIPGHGGPAARS